MATKRRRGEQLEAAIMEAALEILVTAGYEQMTFQNVAKKAETSRTIIYGRYGSKIDLLHELVRYKFKVAHGGRLFDSIEDRGSLRADLLAMLEQYQQFFRDMMGTELFHAILFELSKDNGQFREIFVRVHSRNIEVMKRIQEFAKQRGDIRHDFTDMQMSFPFDLLRFENIVRGGDVTGAYLVRMVDEVLLPIYRNDPSTGLEVK